tara:strand:+ start:2619 stop:3479 length:861 start_codon:yes stop_codon:yes gene_type:complete
MRKNKFWILLGVMILLSLGSQLLAQANRILTLSPTAQTSSIGNVMLPMMNPARNLFDKDMFSFSRVNWMPNIVDDMTYNFVSAERGEYGINVLFFNYGEQKIADIDGIIQGKFQPSSLVYGISYARKVSKFNLGLDAKIITHDLHTQKATGFVFGVGGYFPKVYKDLDVDVMVRNFGFAPKFGSWVSELPTSLNVAGTYPYKDFMFYGQFNKMKKHQTFGMGTSYNYKNMLWGKLGYYMDDMHELTYPTFGLDFKYDKYVIGMSYIYGDNTLPLGNTIRLTINLEL